MPDFGIFRGFNSKLFSDKLFAGQLPTQLGKIGSESFSYLLDNYPNAAAAYSLRLLRTAYTGNCIRVRRSSDNTEQDIGFTALGALDTTSLTTFCGSGNGFVTTWYDQSGNGRNATQTTAANQPQIVSSGSVINVNSNPSLKFDGITDKLLFTYQWANSTFSTFNVFRHTTTQFKAFLAEGNGNNRYLAMGISGSVLAQRFFIADSGISGYPFSSVALLNQQYLTNYYSTGISSGAITAKFRVNNGSEESVTGNIGNTNSSSVIGAAGTGDFWAGELQEIILYQSDQSSNRTGISTNINSYYGIY